MSLDFHPLIRRFLDLRPGAAITIDVDGLPLFRDWMTRGQFVAWFRKQGHEVDEAAMPGPGPPVVRLPRGVMMTPVALGADLAGGPDVSVRTAVITPEQE